MKRVGRSVPVARARTSAGANGPWLTSQAVSGRSGRRKPEQSPGSSGGRGGAAASPPPRTAAPGPRRRGRPPGGRPATRSPRRPPWWSRPRRPSAALWRVRGQPSHQQLAPPADVRRRSGAPPGGAGASAVRGRARPAAPSAVVDPSRLRGRPSHGPAAPDRALCARYQSARVSGIPDSPASPWRTASIWWTAIDALLESDPAAAHVELPHPRPLDPDQGRPPRPTPPPAAPPSCAG